MLFAGMRSSSWLGAAAAPEVDSRYYPAFDYLRIILATSVAASHVGLLTWKHAGNFPVQIFFALSGWLIGGILLKSELKDLPRFYFNRAARIWIPYGFAILLLVAVSLAKEPITAKWFEFIFYKVTFVYNLFGPPQLQRFQDAMPLQGTGNHFWSICSEEQFYLLAPILLIFLPAGRSIWLWFFIAIGLLFSPYWNYFASIALGVLAAVIRVHLGDWHTTAAARFALFGGAIVLIGAAHLDLTNYRLISPIISVGIVLFLAQPGQFSKVGSFFGGVSYPMYLNHWLGTFLAHEIFGKVGMRNSVAAQVSSVIIAIAIATILYCIIDRNVKSYRDGYFTERRGSATAAIGFTLVSVGLIVGNLVY